MIKKCNKLMINRSNKSLEKPRQKKEPTKIPLK